MLLGGVRIDPSVGGERIACLPFLSRGPVELKFRSPVTFLIGENGSGKTTLLEAIAARCAIRPGGGRSYAETDDDREATAISDAVEVTFGGRRPRGMFLRADRFAETMARAGRIPMPTTGEWRLADEQSRGEGVLSLLTARVDASGGCCLSWTSRKPGYRRSGRWRCFACSTICTATAGRRLSWRRTRRS